MKGNGSGPRTCVTTSKGNSRLRSQWQKRKPCLIRWVDAADGSVGRPLLLSGCRGWTTAQRDQGRAGPSSSGQPHPKDRWGTERLKAYGCRGPAQLSTVPEPPTPGGVGTAALVFRGQGEEGQTLSPRSESDLLSTPFLPKNTFLAKSLREEGDLFPGRAAGGVTVAPAPPNPGRGGGEQGQRPPRPVPPPPVSLTQRPSRPPF